MSDTTKEIVLTILALGFAFSLALGTVFYYDYKKDVEMAKAGMEQVQRVGSERTMWQKAR